MLLSMIVMTCEYVFV